MTGEPAVEACDLEVRHGDFAAVRGISFTVRRGEVFALLGVNGAGKTSTLDVLAGHARASGGAVRVFGVDPFRQRRHIARRIGIVPQEGGLFAELTVAETVRCWRRFTTKARPAAEALDLVDLGDRRNVPVGRLSGGERRRLDLALALLGRPEMMFLDEPTSGLDPQARQRTWELVRRLTADGAGVLLTTHHMEEAESLAHHVAIMDRGRIAREGTVTEVLRQVPARVSFRMPDGLRVDELPPLPDTEIHELPHGVVLTTPRPQLAASILLRWAEDAGVTLPELEISHGSLEEVFLDVAMASARPRIAREATR
jgi:ABC-2 type transport system ATP-binding protein